MTPILTRKDGRAIIDPPCDFGHTSQAMECPSCSERLTGHPTPEEWWVWYRKRSQSKRRTGRAIG